ncbi:hypothetical protein LCGC14_1462350, partial [marine sediment metagenome]
MSNPKEKVGLTKPQMHLIPPVADIYEAKVMEGGAKDYGPFNWRDQPVNFTTYISAIKRHLDALRDGETLDKKSGLPHAAHIRANTGIILDAMECGTLIDDRPTQGKASELLDRFTTKKKTSWHYATKEEKSKFGEELDKLRETAKALQFSAPAETLEELAQYVLRQNHPAGVGGFDPSFFKDPGTEGGLNSTVAGAGNTIQGDGSQLVDSVRFQASNNVRGEKLNTKELRDVVQQCRAETHIAYLIANGMTRPTGPKICPI